MLPLGKSFLIPIGRSFSSQDRIEIRINGVIVHYKKTYDGYGGYWAKISSDELGDSSILKTRYIRHRDTLSTYQGKTESIASWVTPSYFIDSETRAIQERAHQIYDDTQSIKENVKAISDFVTGYLEFKKGFHRAPHSLKASQTLLQREGVCINFSRLFIALCRASGIAARSISGVVLSREYPDQYDSHHEWAEYMDEDGVWRPMDLTYTRTISLSDIRYTDLVFAAEDHAYFASVTNKNLASGQPMSLENNDIVLFHYHPIFPGANKYGFKLIEDNRPEFFVIEKTINIIKKGNQILIRQNSESAIAPYKIPENLDELIELNTPIKTISEPEYSSNKMAQIPTWLEKYNGKIFIYKRKMFRTEKTKFEVNYEKNEVFQTEYDGNNNPTRYKLGLTDPHFTEKTKRGTHRATKATFRRNIIIVDLAAPELGWRAKSTYQFSGETVELRVIDLNGTEYYTQGYVVE